MFRLFGFLIGSTISIAVILLVTGLPEFRGQSPEIDQKRFDEAVEMLMARKVDAERAGTLAAASDAIEPQADTEAETPEPLEQPAVHAIAQDPQWYSFWNPFRSQIAASGFVSRLEEVTGLDYRVVKVKSGVYEVAFSYFDDEERRTKLAAISDATGLELPDS